MPVAGQPATDSYDHGIRHFYSLQASVWGEARKEFDPGQVFLSLPFQPNLISHVQTTTLLPLLVSSTPFLINVSFDFFNPNPKVDYHALTRLLSQLFPRDAERLHIRLLVELISVRRGLGRQLRRGCRGRGGGRSVCCAECCYCECAFAGEWGCAGCG